MGIEEYGIGIFIEEKSIACSNRRRHNNLAKSHS